MRIEREHHLLKSFIQVSDPECLHTVHPLDLAKLPGRQEDEVDLIVSIFESPGPNYIKNLVDLGPAWLGPTKNYAEYLGGEDKIPSPQDGVPMSTFLSFAIGACECLELLHHGLRIVHGELRADAFHFNHETGAVKMINFGSGPRSFQNGLTSSGWMTLSREVGVKHKLQYIAPEQTGRMPAEPNSRTDVYSLGVLFWTMLTGKPAFLGETPLDVCVLCYRPFPLLVLDDAFLFEHLLEQVQRNIGTAPSVAFFWSKPSPGAPCCLLLASQVEMTMLTLHSL